MSGPAIMRLNDKAAIFIHIPRTGGRSVFRAFPEMQRAHITAEVARRWYPDECDEGALFTIVRHPCGQVLSWFRNVYPTKSSAEFRDWLRIAYDGQLQPLARASGAVSPLDQTAWVDEDTTVFKYPDLQGAVTWACHRLGLSPREPGQVGRRGGSLAWHDWYDVAAERFVRERRKAEFERWFRDEDD